MLVTKPTLSLHRILGLALAVGLFASPPIHAAAAEGKAAESKAAEDSTIVGGGSLRGILRGHQDIEQSSKSAGVIEKFGAEEGDQVNKGDILVQLNSEIEKAELKRAEAVLEGVKHENERARRELERVTNLYNGVPAVGAKKDVEEAESQFGISVARRKNAEAEVEISRARLNERFLAAQISGILLRRTRAVGEAVERLEPVVRIVDASKLSLIVGAGPELMGKFKVGQTLKLLVETGASKGTVVPAIVSKIDPIMNSDSLTFRIKLEVEPSETAMPGIPAVLQIPSEVMEK